MRCINVSNSTIGFEIRGELDLSGRGTNPAGPGEREYVSRQREVNIVGDDDEPQTVNTGSAKGRKTSALAGCVIYVAINAVLLFGSAGTLDWPMAWAFIFLSLAVFIAGILRSRTDLIDERSSRHKDSKGWDRVLVSVLMAISFIILIVAGLTVRFGQDGQVPLSVQVIALIILTLGNGLIVWATWTNRFFSATVRIQTDRNHAVVSDGPYGYVRHPGYAGMIVYSLFEPLALGSYWALVPAFLAVVLFVVRTHLEDKTLREELPGYRDYAGQVRYRLVPHVW
jgi:protein-S-isoprenylcysteine O-methyltransferase Ste14